MSEIRPRRRRPLWVNVLLGGAALALVGLLVTATLFLANGGRWFVVATPSMGTAAPVGTLVLTTSTRVSALQAGDIISFHPPTAPSETYTHRILAISADGGVTTKGDINGATDPWTLHDGDLIGEATTVIPGIGWLARALPILAVGFVLVLLITRLIRSLQWRASFRIVGLSLVVAIAAVVLRPFTGIVLLQTYARDGHAGATVVSTGLLPIRVTAKHGTHVDLLTGQVGQLSIPASAHEDTYQLASALHLDLWGWIVFLLICFLPLLAVLIFGLPSTESEYTVRLPLPRHEPDFVAERQDARRAFELELAR